MSVVEEVTDKAAEPLVTCDEQNAETSALERTRQNKEEGHKHRTRSYHGTILYYHIANNRIEHGVPLFSI